MAILRTLVAILVAAFLAAACGSNVPRTENTELTTTTTTTTTTTGGATSDTERIDDPKADLLEALGAIRVWQATELTDADGSVTLLFEGPWLQVGTRDSGDGRNYVGTISGCIMGNEYGFVLTADAELLVDSKRDILGIYDCLQGQTPIEVWQAIRAIVFASPTLEITGYGESVWMTDGDTSLTFELQRDR